MYKNRTNVDNDGNSTALYSGKLVITIVVVLIST